MTARSARRFRSALAGAAIVIGGLVAVGSSAQAATCVGSACDGGNPIRTGCEADAEVTGRVALPMYGTDGVLYGRLVILAMYSPTCQASWAKVRAVRLKDALTIDRTAAFLGLPGQPGKVVRGGGGLVRSRMLAGQLGACGRAITFIEPYGWQEFALCTSVG